MVAIFTALKWGWNDSSITYQMKLRVAKAACCQVAYDCGFKYIFSFSLLPVLKKKIDSAIEGNNDYIQFWTHSLLFIQEVKNVSITSNICIWIIFGSCFVMLRILRGTKHLTKKLLLLWIRRVPFLVKLVILCYCTKYIFIDGLLIIQKRSISKIKLLDTPDYKAKRNVS